jgi:hypothetical protein
MNADRSWMNAAPSAGHRHGIGQAFFVNYDEADLAETAGYA